MKFSAILILPCIASLLFGFQSIDSSQNSELKNEALDFSLSIVQAYFDQDCDYVLASIVDSIYMIQDGEYISIQEKKDNFCHNVTSTNLQKKDKTFSNYREQYDAIIFTKDELEEYIGEAMPQELPIQDGDFFFWGGRLKEEFKESGHFMRVNSLYFVVRKIDGNWKIVSILA